MTKNLIAYAKKYLARVYIMPCAPVDTSLLPISGHMGVALHVHTSHLGVFSCSPVLVGSQLTVYCCSSSVLMIWRTLLASRSCSLYIYTPTPSKCKPQPSTSLHMQPSFSFGIFWSHFPLLFLNKRQKQSQQKPLCHAMAS